MAVRLREAWCDAEGQAMIVLLLALPLAVLAHEAVHGAILKLGGARPELAIRHGWDRRLLLSAGLGWAYHTDGVSASTRRLSYLLGPLAGLAVWLVAALAVGGWWGLWRAVIGAADFCANWWLGSSCDGAGWRRLG